MRGLIRCHDITFVCTTNEISRDLMRPHVTSHMSAPTTAEYLPIDLFYCFSAPPFFFRVELIMAVGLVVDYMVHIIHYFLHQVRLH